MTATLVCEVVIPEPIHSRSGNSAKPRGNNVRFAMGAGTNPARRCLPVMVWTHLAPASAKDGFQRSTLPDVVSWESALQTCISTSIIKSIDNQNRILRVVPTYIALIGDVITFPSFPRKQSENDLNAASRKRTFVTMRNRRY